MFQPKRTPSSLPLALPQYQVFLYVQTPRPQSSTAKAVSGSKIYSRRRAKTRPEARIQLIFWL